MTAAVWAVAGLLLAAAAAVTTWVTVAVVATLADRVDDEEGDDRC